MVDVARFYQKQRIVVNNFQPNTFCVCEAVIRSSLVPIHNPVTEKNDKRDTVPGCQIVTVINAYVSFRTRLSALITK